MLTLPSVRSRAQRIAAAASSVFLVTSLALPVAASAEDILQTVEVSGTAQRTLAGAAVLNDVIARDSSQLSLAEDATGVDTAVDGNALGFGTARIFISHSRIAGNVNASEDSIIVLERSVVDGNVEVNGNGVVAIGPQTVVSGNIDGIFLGTDVDGYAIYVGI